MVVRSVVPDIQLLLQSVLVLTFSLHHLVLEAVAAAIFPILG